MIWLCQATFAGIGAVAAAQLAVAPRVAGPASSVLVGGLIAMPFGVVIGLVTIRLGNLYVALVTLTVGLLFDDLVFTQQIFSNYSIGVNVNLPSFASSPRAFTYLALGVFALAALRHAQPAAVDDGPRSECGALEPGRGPDHRDQCLQMKVLVSGIAAFVAGIGGAMYALSLGSALPTNYSSSVGFDLARHPGDARHPLEHRRVLGRGLLHRPRRRRRGLPPDRVRARSRRSSSVWVPCRSPSSPTGR